MNAENLRHEIQELRRHLFDARKKNRFLEEQEKQPDAATKSYAELQAQMSTNFETAKETALNAQKKEILDLCQKEKDEALQQQRENLSGYFRVEKKEALKRQKEEMTISFETQKDDALKR